MFIFFDRFGHKISGPRAMVRWKSISYPARQPIFLDRAQFFEETIHRCVVLKIVSMEFELQSRILRQKYTRRSISKNRVYKNRNLTSIFDVSRRFYRHDFSIEGFMYISLLDFSFLQRNP